MTTGRPPHGGLTEVLLPSGARVRGHLPTLGTLLRRDLLPRDLVAVAMKAANPAWLQVARAVDPEEGAAAARYLAVLTAAFPRERWVGPDEDGWEPWRLTPADLVADAVDESDVDAMENLVLRLMTPDELTLTSREILGITTSDDGEVPAGIPGWEGFRGESRRGAAGDDGEGMGTAPELDAGGA